MGYGVRKQLKSFVNFPKWMGAKDIGSTGKSVYNALKKVVSKDSTFKETYDEAIKRMGLDEAHLAQRQAGFLRTSVFYLVMALGMMLYMLYLFSESHWHAAIMTLSISAILLSFAFREHFWYTQMKHKRLGMTFQDWLSATFGGK